jgi:PAS domain S-box-containing protein
MDNTHSTNADYEELKRDYKELKEKYQEEAAKNVHTSLVQNREQYLESILDTTHDGFWVVNNKGIITDVNSSYCRMSGYSRSEIIGMKISDLDVDETPEETKARIDRIIINGSETFSARHRRKDGSILSVEISVSYQKENGDKICFCRDITDRRKAEQALKESEEKYKSLFESINDGVCLHELVYDESGQPANYRIIDVNKKYEEIVGLRKEDVINKLATEVYPGEEVPYLREFSNVAISGKPFRFETYFDGHQKHYFISVFSSGKNKFATVFQDISDRKKTEEALRESEEKLRLIINNSPNPVAITDIQNEKILYLSHSFYELIGYSPSNVEEWYQMAYPDPKYREDVISRWKPFLEIAKKSDKPFNTGEYEITCSDGSVIICELSIRFLKEFLIISINNITDRKQAENALKESESKYKEMFNFLPFGISITDKSGKPDRK